MFSNMSLKGSKSKTFKMIAGGIYSKSCLPAPNLSHFELEINYPPILEKIMLKNIERFRSQKELGLRGLFSQKCRFYRCFLGTSAIRAEYKNKNKFSFVRTVKTSKRYTILPFNKQVSSTDSISYYFDVIKDRFQQLM